ncbi:cytochrome P450 [Streptomyces sp. NL15-2K]|uniref:cytochrome P450 n=1 Tax=Streptomyces sp. NL15-2K TaxID=376149 RepID=UPI000F565FB6|nr:MULTISPECIES: cytochrome P450 [Actinomycetes]WKX06932.1 cytochrome P450 [Kutzneria buriramensis]
MLPVSTCTSIRRTLIRAGTLPVHVLNAPALAHRVLVTEADGFDKGRLLQRARPVLGRGLFASDGDDHRRQRRLLQPAFHHQFAASWARVTEAETAAMCAAWRPGQVVDVVTLTRTLATRVVLRALFPAEPSDRTIARVNHALPILLRGFIPRLLRPDGLVGRLPTPGSVRFERAAQELRGALHEIIASYRNAHAPYAPHAQDAGAGGAGEGGLLPLLCGSAPGGRPVLPDDRVRDEAVTMLLAGGETTSTSLTWLLHELDRHPEVRSRLRREIGAAGSDAAATRERAPYLHDVLKENLRLHTPTWVLTRRARRPFQHGGVQMAAGAEILFSPLAMHTDSRLYPRPHVCDPDRWTRADVPRDAFMPFGAGVHKCIGEGFALTETAVALSVIVSSWDLATTGRSDPRAGKHLVIHQPRRLLMTVMRPPRRS